MVNRLFVCLIAVAAISLSAKEASASEFEFRFGCISSDATDCGILETQLFVTVGLNADDPTRVDFTFRNEGPAASSITDIYFDDPPPLLGLPAYITQSSGVSFSATCDPKKLPGGNTVGFTTKYCADSESPAQPMGVNPEEWVKLSYTLQGDAELLDVLKAIEAGTFRVGIHVQGFSDEGSVSGIVNTLPVPEPTSMVLLGSGAVAAALARRRRKTAA